MLLWSFLCWWLPLSITAVWAAGAQLCPLGGPCVSPIRLCPRGGSPSKCRPGDRGLSASTPALFPEVYLGKRTSAGHCLPAPLRLWVCETWLSAWSLTQEVRRQTEKTDPKPVLAAVPVPLFSSLKRGGREEKKHCVHAQPYTSQCVCFVKARNGQRTSGRQPGRHEHPNVAAAPGGQKRQGKPNVRECLTPKTK